jgi:hypothetical protein
MNEINYMADLEDWWLMSAKDNSGIAGIHSKISVKSLPGKVKQVALSGTSG